MLSATGITAPPVSAGGTAIAASGACSTGDAARTGAGASSASRTDSAASAERISGAASSDASASGANASGASSSDGATASGAVSITASAVRPRCPPERRFRTQPRWLRPQRPPPARGRAQILFSHGRGKDGGDEDQPAKTGDGGQHFRLPPPAGRAQVRQWPPAPLLEAPEVRQRLREGMARPPLPPAMPRPECPAAHPRLPQRFARPRSGGPDDEDLVVFQRARQCGEAGGFGQRRRSLGLRLRQGHGGRRLHHFRHAVAPPAAGLNEHFGGAGEAAAGIDVETVAARTAGPSCSVQDV